MELELGLEIYCLLPTSNREGFVQPTHEAKGLDSKNMYFNLQ